MSEPRDGAPLSSPHDTKTLVAKFEAQRKKAVWWHRESKLPKPLDETPRGDYQKKRLIKYATW